MARGSVNRRYGPGPYILGLRRNLRSWQEGFPFDLPALAAVEEIRLDQPVTMLAGENRTGKSTVLEAVAAAIGFADEGASSSGWASSRLSRGPSSRPPSLRC
jgi:predicted ATPase